MRKLLFMLLGGVFSLLTLASGVEAGDIAGLGRIVPSTDVINLFGPSGDRVERLTVQEGDRVASGDLLAYLTSYSLREAEKAVAKLELDAIRVRQELELRIQESLVLRLKAEAEMARNGLRQFLVAAGKKEPLDLAQPGAIESLIAMEGLRQPEYRRAEISLADAQTNEELRLEMQRTRVSSLQQDYELAQTRLAAFVQAGAEAYASPDTEAERQQSVMHAKREYETAAIELQRLRRTLSSQVQQAKINVTQATAERMNHYLSSHLKSNEAYEKSGWELEKMRRLFHIEHQKAEQHLRIAAYRLEQSTIRAPITGVVLKALAKPGEPTGRSVLFKLGDADRFFVIAEIYESDALRLRVGQTATISSYALPKKLKGTVESVGSMIFKNTVDSLDPSALTQSRVVEARIRLDSHHLAQKLVYLQVDVLIHE